MALLNLHWYYFVICVNLGSYLEYVLYRQGSLSGNSLYYVISHKNAIGTRGVQNTKKLLFPFFKNTCRGIILA